MKKSYWDEKNGHWVYVCPVCKKYESEWYVSIRDWEKLPDKFRNRPGFTPCKKCFKKLTKIKKLKILTTYEISMGKTWDKNVK